MQNSAVSRRGKTTAWVYGKIRDLIVNKRIPPGSKINQNAMAGEMKISRTPVVNALHKLESEGLVDNIPHTGFFVHQITVKELMDLFALREALDTIVVTEIIDTASDEDLGRLERIFESFRGRGRRIDPEQYRKADVRFHFAMLALCSNSLARRVNESFQVFNRSFMGGLVRRPEETLSEHLGIVSALRSRNIGKARAAVAAHNNGTRAVLQELAVNMRKIGVDPERITLDEFNSRSWQPGGRGAA